MTEKLLIVNADDLGWTEGVNEGIFAAHLNGVVTSATLMVNAPGAAHATAALARPELAGLGVGLHFQLTGGGLPTLPPHEVPSLVDENGRLPRRPEGLGGARHEEVLAEAEAQLARFERMAGRPPTHVDGHHHVHGRPEVLAAITTLATGTDLPVRPVSTGMRDALRDAGIVTPDLFADSFYAERVTAAHLAELVGAVGPGVTEIMCHPGRVDAELERSSTYVTERETELELLTDPELVARIAAENVRLVSYAAL